jgi:Uma2 family endonuclease
MIQHISTQSAPPARRRWTIDEYYRLGEMGFFNDQRVELIDGEVIDMAPQKDIHAVAVGLAFKAVWRAFGDVPWVRCQLPLGLADSNEPEPDVSVVAGPERQYIGKGHPSTAFLVVEVADTSLDFDRTIKVSLYASAAIADYWIVNLIDRQLEVFRRPSADAAARFGWTYADRTILSAADRIKPLAAQESTRVADLLP